jgi:signal transduction histidine kinase
VTTGPDVRDARVSRPWLLPAALAAVAAICVLDWLTPAGVVVGILLGLPILAMALGDDPRGTTITVVAAAAGFVAAAAFGRGPIGPAAVWAPNRLLAFLALPGSYLVARIVQRERLRAAAERERAARASDLNRLLLSLLAHDMRAPLAMAVQAMEYVRSDRGPGAALDPGLLADVDRRLRRGLGSVDSVLRFARGEPGAPARAARRSRTGAELLGELESEARSFEAEAAARGKTLEVSFAGASEAACGADLLLVRQALAIVIDNAIRHAVPGPVRVTGGIDGGELRLAVSDSGPADTAADDDGAAPGAGIGLALCRLLVDRAGGKLTTEFDSGAGTTVRLALPVAGA